MSGLSIATLHRLRPAEGLHACGDAVVDASAPGWRLLAVIDALGHGPDAARSAQSAQVAAQNAVGQPLSAVFSAVHHSLARLRGVVMSAILIEGEAAVFAGVGNVELFGPPGVNRPITMAGTLGGGAYRFRPFPLLLRPGQRWALASAGIKTREGAALFLKLVAAPAQEMVDALIERASRPHDDVAVLIIDTGAAA